MLGLGGVTVAAAALSAKQVKKAAALQLADWTGTMDWVMNSPWRQKRVLILGFHGVACLDEDRQCPILFMSSERFARHLELLRELRCGVLGLQDALDRLQRGTLPERSVVLTFDDGYRTFDHVVPQLQKYGFPATVYLTTEYMDHDLPVFNLLCPYLFWKTSLDQVTLDGFVGLPQKTALAIRTPLEREAAANFVKDFSKRLSVQDRDRNARRLAELLRVDYAKIFDQKIFHCMSRTQVKTLADAGIDFQMHTHEHWLPTNDAGFAEAIGGNRSRILSVTGREPKHLAYPSGVTNPAFFRLLKQQRVATAVTADPGLVSKASHPHQLERCLDSEFVSDIVFRSWVSGLASFVPGSAHFSLASVREFVGTIRS